MKASRGWLSAKGEERAVGTVRKREKKNWRKDSLNLFVCEGSDRGLEGGLPRGKGGVKGSASNTGRKRKKRGGAGRGEGKNCSGGEGKKTKRDLLGKKKGGASRLTGCSVRERGNGGRFGEKGRAYWFACPSASKKSTERGPGKNCIPP